MSANGELLPRKPPKSPVRRGGRGHGHRQHGNQPRAYAGVFAHLLSRRSARQSKRTVAAAFLEHCLQKDKPRTERVYAALGMGAQEFSQKLALLLGERERYADAELRSWAHKAAQSRKKCAISFTEDELFAVLKESVGR